MDVGIGSSYEEDVTLRVHTTVQKKQQIQKKIDLKQKEIEKLQMELHSTEKHLQLLCAQSN